MTPQNKHTSGISIGKILPVEWAACEDMPIQHLRVKESKPVGEDGGRCEAERVGKRPAVAFVHAAVLLVALALIPFAGCTSADRSSPASEVPTLQFVGTKPDSIRMGLAVRYIAQSKEDRCQKFTTESMSMKPLKKLSFIFPGEPESSMFIPNNASVRVVPIDIEYIRTTTNRYNWIVSLGWFDEPRRCDFTPHRVSVDLYNAAGHLIGGTLIKANSWPSEREPAPTFTPLRDSILLRCSWHGRTRHRENLSSICQTEGEEANGFQIQAKRGDTTRVNLSIVD